MFHYLHTPASLRRYDAGNPKLSPARSRNPYLPKPLQNERRRDDDTTGGSVIIEVPDPAEKGVIFDDGVRDDLPR